MSYPLNGRRVAIAICVLAALAPRPSIGGEPERWGCDVELRQGETGRLVLNRTGGRIEGSLVLGRGGGAAPGAATIKGSWSADVIRFVRTGPDGEQPFMGIAVATGAGASKMAGRFGANYDGVWSATCSMQAGEDAPAPSVPEAPVTPPPASPASPRACTISGSATGPRASLASAYQVVLRGPNSLTKVAGRRPFGSGQFSFTNLADGAYVLTIDTKADVSVQITPRRHDITCSGAAIAGRNFEFR